MPLTKLNNKAVANVTSLPVALGDMVLVSSATASSSAYIDFSLGNYKEYQFYFVNMHPQNDGTGSLEFNFSIDNGSTYSTIKTTTQFITYHDEAGGQTDLSYYTSGDLAQSTSFQQLSRNLGGQSDESLSGYMSIFNPSSTTYVKHFISNTQEVVNDIGGVSEGSLQCFVAGYANTTSALTNIRFRMTSGNIDAGTILMYGIN